MIPRHSHQACLFLLLTLATLAVSCGPAQTEDGKVVRAAYVPAGFYLPFLVAEQEQLFERRDWSLELVRFNDNSHMISLFLNGQLDVTAQSCFTMFPIEAENPGLFRFVYGQYANSYFFVVPDSQGIRQLHELGGRTVGTWKSPTAENFIRLILANHGLQPGDYSIQRFGATEWAPALENDVVPAVFGFDVPAAGLVAKGSYAYLEQNAVAQLLGGLPVFNGGAFVARDLAQRDPEKMRVIREVMLEAVRIINEEPGRAYEAAATVLGAPLNTVKQAHFDTFAEIDDQTLESAEATLDLLTTAGIVSEQLNPADMLRDDG